MKGEDSEDQWERLELLTRFDDMNFKKAHKKRKTK